MLPEQFKDDPHKYIARLNGGNLPYELASELHRTPAPAIFNMPYVNARSQPAVVTSCRNRAQQPANRGVKLDTVMHGREIDLKSLRWS